MNGYLQRLILRGAGAAPRSALQSPPPAPIVGPMRRPEIPVEGATAAPPLASDSVLGTETGRSAAMPIAPPQPSEPQWAGSVPQPAAGTDRRVDPVARPVPQPRVHSPAPASTHEAPPRRAAQYSPESAPRSTGAAAAEERITVAPSRPVSVPPPAGTSGTSGTSGGYGASGGYATVKPGVRPPIGTVASLDNTTGSPQQVPEARGADPATAGPVAALAMPVQAVARGTRSPAAVQVPDLPARGTAEAPPVATHPPEMPAARPSGTPEPPPVAVRPPAMPRPQPLPPRQRQTAAQAAPSVTVRIGRVEVRAEPVPEPAPAAAEPRGETGSGFDDYLSLRSYSRTDL